MRDDKPLRRSHPSKPANLFWVSRLAFFRLDCQQASELAAADYQFSLKIS